MDSENGMITSEKLTVFQADYTMTEREEKGMYKWSEFMAHAEGVSDEVLKSDSLH